MAGKHERLKMLKAMLSSRQKPEKALFRSLRLSYHKSILCLFLCVIFSWLVPSSGAHSPEEKISVPLTAHERAWISKHKVILIAPDPYFPPIDWIDKKGTYRGISADFMRLVENKTGIKFKVVKCKNWDEVLDKARSRKVDAIPAAAQTPERSKYLIYSDPHIVLPGVIITRKKVTKKIILEDLSAMRVSVVQGYLWQEFLEKDFPKIKLDLVHDLREGLKKVALGVSDACVATLPVALYYIEKEGITNLRVAGETGYHTRLSFASRKDWPELNAIVKKALAQIPRSKKEDILKKWIRLGERSIFMQKKFWMTILAVIGACGLMILGIALWNRSLRRMVDQRTEELESELIQRKEAEEILKRSEEKFEKAFHHGPTLMAISSIKDGKYTEVNNNFVGVTGYSEKEVIGTTPLDLGFILPEDFDKLKKDLKEYGSVDGMELTLRKKDGDILYCLYFGEIITIDGEQRLLSIASDITDRKQAEQRIEHTNLVLKAIRNVNQLITKEKERDKLLKGVCNNLVENRGYHNAWVVLLDESGKPLTSAEAGLGDDFVPMLESFKRGDLTDCGRKAISQPGIVITEDPSSIFLDCPLAEKYMGRYAMTARLEHEGKVYGFLSVSMAGDLIAYREEQELFEEVTEDIAYALYNMDQEDERKRAETALKANEEKYRSLVETMTDGVFIIDTNGRFTFLNPEFENIIGLVAPDYIGHSFTEILAPEYIESTVERFSRGLSGETIPIYEVGLKHKDGKMIPVELKVTSLFDEHGKIIGRIGVARDIRERRMVEEKLRESEREMSAILNTMSELVAYQDTDHNVLWTNKAAADSLGKDPEDLKGKKCYEIWAGRGEQCETCPVARAIESGKMQQDEITTPDGRTWFIKGYPIKNEVGQITAAVEVTLDVTEQKRAEQALLRSELELSIRNRIANIFLTISDDEMYGRVLDIILEAMESTFGIFGYLDEQGSLVCPTMTRDIWVESQIPDKDIIFPREKWGGIWGRAMSEKKTLYSNESFKVPDGHIPITRSLTVPIVHQSEVIGILTVANKEKDYKKDDKKLLENIVDYIAPVLNARLQRDREVDKGKKLESQLQQAQRMEALGTLGGGIAHDFNNLLMGIQGRTSLMIMDVDSSHPHLEHLKGIEEYIKSAADLTKQLLGFARGGKYEVKPTDINELIKRTSGMFGRTKKEIKIHGKYQKDLWTLEADQGQIEQVLMNLYVNAWQAMPGGGDLYLQTENVTLDENYLKPFHIEPGRYVKISLTDTGVGMDEDVQQRIFDPFFTTKEMGRGTGLGLASAYGIIKNHSGFIDVSSKKEVGSTFTIYLPASEKEIIEEKELSKEALKGSEAVLLVDDEDMIIEVGEQLLIKLGYKVFVARDGKEAIEIFKENKDQIDMVIVDMIMPGMGGGETFDRLKEIKPDIKVLLSSGYSIDGQATEILERGCDGFIHKPFDMKQLSGKLREILGKE